MMSDRPRPRIELSTVQVVSSMAAAVTGAVLTSYLGDGGTILGTAVGSGASTAGFAVYKHYLSRTKEKVAPVIVEHARQWTPTGTALNDSRSARHDGVTRADATRADDATRVDRPVSSGNGNGRSYTAADWEQARRTAPGWAQPTQAEPGWGPDATRQDLGQTRQDQGRTGQDQGQTGQDQGRTREDYGQPRFIPEPTQQDYPPTRTTRYGTVRMGDGTMVNGGPGGDGSGGPDSGAPGGGAGDGRHGKPGRGLNFLAGRPRWVATAATAAAVFIVVMIGITIFELGTGKPIAASVWNRQQTGTTLGGSSSKTTPSTTPTQSPTSPSSVGATGGVQSSASPTTGPTPTPTVSPSSVPSVGSTAGATAPASRGPGAGAPAGTASSVPGQ
jgi:hypothetical protein